MPTPSRRRLRAPEADCAALIDPPLSEVSKLLEHNRRIASDFDRLGVLPPQHNRMMARVALLATAGAPGASQLKSAAQGPIMLTGHQPELFHPGVWYKNFVLGSLAQRIEAVGIHLLIDSDMCRGATRAVRPSN